MRISCATVRARVAVPEHCCDSCHDDFELGYHPLIEVEPGDEFAFVLRDGETAAEVCCVVFRAIRTERTV